jgi:MFS family permease
MVTHAINDGFLWIIPPLLPALREYFNLSYTEMGFFYTLYRFSGGILQAPAAYLVHLGPIFVILAGGLLWMSVGMFLATLSPSYGYLISISALSAIGRSTYHPLGVTILSRVFGRHSFGRAMALHLSASSAGMVVGPFLVGLLLTVYSWRLPLQIWSAAGTVVALILFFFMSEQKHDLQAETKILRWPFLSRSIGFYVLAVCIWAIAQSGLMTFLPLFLVDYRGFSTATSAMTFGMMAISGLVGRPFVGALMDRMRRRKPVVIGGFIIGGLSILMVTTIDNLWVLYLAIVLVGIFGSGHTGLSDTLMTEMIPSHRREETLGFYYSIRMAIGSLSPVIVGWASERISLYDSFVTLSVLAGLAALILTATEERTVE